MPAEQIDPLKAIAYAVEMYDNDSLDAFCAMEFLRDCRQHDMETIGQEWPKFVQWVRAHKDDQVRLVSPGQGSGR